MGLFELHFNSYGHQVNEAKPAPAAHYNEHLSAFVPMILLHNWRVATAEGFTHPGLYQTDLRSQPSPIPQLRPMLPQSYHIGNT